jgi:hypothetical protein
MSTPDEVRELLRQTPAYMSHITLGRWLVEWLLKELIDKDKEIKQLRDDLDNERKRHRD